MGGGDDRGENLSQSRFDELSGRTNAGERLVGTDALEFGQFASPGQIDLSVENPALFGELGISRRRRAESEEFFDEFLDPSLVNARIGRETAQATTRAQGQFSRLGLGGSSVGIGGSQEAGRQARFAGQDRALSDQLRSLQALTAQDASIRGTILQGQNQFAGFQANVLGLEAANSGPSPAFGLAGTILGGAAGFAIGGPPGAAIGAGLGGGLGGAAGGGAAGSSFRPSTVSSGPDSGGFN